jgi:hypothetical protein
MIALSNIFYALCWGMRNVNQPSAQMSGARPAPNRYSPICADNHRKIKENHCGLGQGRSCWWVRAEPTPCQIENHSQPNLMAHSYGCHPA